MKERSRASWVSFLAMASVIVLNLIESTSARPNPWEPYQEMDTETQMRQHKNIHELMFQGIGVVAPMIDKIAKDKYRDYMKKFHGPKSFAGKAGAKESSEEESDSGSDEMVRTQTIRNGTGGSAPAGGSSASAGGGSSASAGGSNASAGGGSASAASAPSSGSSAPSSNTTGSG